MENKTQQFSDIFGLNTYETKLYLALVYGGPLMVSRMAKEASIPRTAVYTPLQTLLSKGFVSLTVVGKRKYYQAIGLDKLKYIVEQRKLEADRLISEIEGTEHISSPKNNLAIQYFIGKQGITTAGQIFLKETKTKIWYSFENLVGITEFVGLDFESSYIRERVCHNIKSKMIVTTDVVTPWLRDYLSKDKEQLRESVIVSPQEYRFDSTIVATKGFVLLINAKENPFAILIRNDHVANTLIDIHKLSWDRFK